MLSNKEEKMEMKEEAIYCAKCDEEMKPVLLEIYEYLEGHPLHDVPAYKCQSCRYVFFTEKQATDMERRTENLLKEEFGFERKITISGKSLVITIPHELARHLKLQQGTTVKITHMPKRGLMVRKVEK